MDSAAFLSGHQSLIITSSPEYLHSRKKQPSIKLHNFQKLINIDCLTDQFQYIKIQAWLRGLGKEVNYSSLNLKPGLHVRHEHKHKHKHKHKISRVNRE